MVFNRTAALTINADRREYTSFRSNIDHALRIVRSHFDMDIAFVTEFIGQFRRFRHVNSKAAQTILKSGDWIPLDAGYCQKIVDGRLPELIPDTANVPAAMDIPETHALPIGSHLSIPLRLSDGELYGTFCCFSHEKKSLNETDLRTMRAFGNLVEQQLDCEMIGIRERTEIFDRIDSVLRSDQPAMVYQPSYSLSDHRLLGAESLSRFASAPHRTPDVWFAEAGRVNLKTDLELKAIRNALAGFAPAWRSGPYHLGINSSPQTILDPQLNHAIASYPADRIILEITEHDHVENYDELMRALNPLRERGIQIAVDDAGSGYASMRHILNIKPDVIKLDVSLTQEIDSDPTRRALANALCEFGRQTGCSLVAEGIETKAQLETLRGIGVQAAQGYYLGRPMPFGDFSRLLVRSDVPYPCRRLANAAAKPVQMTDMPSKSPASLLHH